ncbi:MAG: hypothetical protein OGMRLDGQ_000016 [Candidatus Fervidibacter sp.]
MDDFCADDEKEKPVARIRERDFGDTLTSKSKRQGVKASK